MAVKLDKRKCVAWHTFSLPEGRCAITTNTYHPLLIKAKAFKFPLKKQTLI